MAGIDAEGGLIKRCAENLGITSAEVAYIIHGAPKKYKVYPIDKRDGGHRIICQPSRELKAIQYYLLGSVLRECRVHPQAMAYESGTSIRMNAEAHSNARVLMKTDFQAFFPSIRVADWVRYARRNFPKWSKEDIVFTALAMFWGAGTSNPVCLSIGAPTSPKLSNILMYEFDEIMNDYAVENSLVYTRYADDITISSRGFLDFEKSMNFMRVALQKISYPNLTINDAKTGLYSKGRRLQVTGLIISNSNEVSLGRDRKRSISSMVHKWSIGVLDNDQVPKLKGLLAFAMDVEPEFVGRLREKYGAQVVKNLMGKI